MNLKERLLQEKNKDHNTKLWGNIWLTIVVMAFFVGVGVGGAYYSVKMNGEMQRALNIIAHEKQLNFNDLPPELNEMFKQYRVNESQNFTDDYVMKIESCDEQGCREIG